MDYQFSKIMGLLTTSGAFLMLVLLAGTALLWLRPWRFGRTLVTLVALLLAILTVTPLQPWLTGGLEDRFPANPELPEHVDGIIILGGMIRPNISLARHRPTLNDAAERLLEGARLAALHPEAKVLFTGGSPNPWNPEAREANFVAEVLKQMGVAGDRLIIEDRSRNTYENAVFSKQLVPEGGSWVLVTSAIHLPRAVGVFRKAGWKVIPWPSNYLTGGDEDWANEDIPVLRLYRLSRTFHEWVGLIYYRMRGWSASLLPGPSAAA
jgi:uncharacterized SAM-binding protein YcdF (DUF218 family)